MQECDERLLTPFPRRQILKLLSLASVGLALDPLLLMKEAKSNPVAPQWVQAAAQLLKELIKYLVRYILPSVVAGYVVEKVMRAEAKVVPRPANFHEKFSPTVKLDAGVQPVATKFNNGSFFDVDGFARLDNANPLRPIKDLNERELRRIVDPSDVRYYGCVPFPCSERRVPTEKDDLGLFRKTVEGYKLNPDYLALEYVRSFSNGASSFLGYGVSDIDDASKSALLLAKCSCT